MNRIAAGLALLCLSTSPGWPVDAGAGEKPKTIVLRDVDEGGLVFTFSDGSLVDPKVEPAAFLKFDLMLDLPHGLAANHPDVVPYLRGKSGIVDMGAQALKDVREAPKVGYRPALKPDAIKDGHTYCVLTADGARHGKFHVVRFDREQGTLEFTWAFQPQPTNRFE